MILKLGPLAKSNSCTGVRGVLERFMTNFFLVVLGAIVLGTVGVVVLLL